MVIYDNLELTSTEYNRDQKYKWAKKKRITQVPRDGVYGNEVQKHLLGRNSLNCWLLGANKV